MGHRPKYRIEIQYTTTQGFHITQGYGPVYGATEAHHLAEFFNLDLRRKGFTVTSVKVTQVRR